MEYTETKEFAFSNDCRIIKKQLFPTEGITLAAIGTLLLALASTYYVPEGTLSLLFASFGIGIIIIGIVKICNPKINYYDKETRCLLKEYCVNFDPKQIKTIDNLYLNHSFESLVQMKKEDQSGLVLHLYGNSGENIFYSLLMHYEPYQYVPMHNVERHTDKQEITSITRLLKHKG